MKSKIKDHHPNAVMTLTFQDHGQDFLEWDLDAKHYVIESRPFQNMVWCGYQVVNHPYTNPLKVGNQPSLRSKTGRRASLDQD